MFTAGLLIAVLNEAIPSRVPILVGVVILIIGLAFWNHWAITKRRVGQITAIAIMNLIAGGNVIGCLIMISIRRVTLNEHKKYIIKNA